jgi:CO/xanthine dehydrogenase Mo-binding subunit
MQLGCTMSERMEYVNGQLTNGSLADYKIPGIRDMPDAMENDFVDARQAGGPHGAKGVGETATFGVSPAITNAIHDAVGVRLTRLPVTAEAVYRALRANDNDPLKDA